jgi:hypothetical protein
MTETKNIYDLLMNFPRHDNEENSITDHVLFGCFEKNFVQKRKTFLSSLYILL